MSSQSHLNELRDVLSWATPLDIMTPLLASVRGVGAGTLSENAAVCFDSNVFLNLGKGKKATELIDYFGEKHKGPIVVPQQSLLELWNNHLSSVETLVGKLRRQSDELSRTIQEVDPDYSALKDGAEALVKDFQAEWGHVFSKTTQTDLLALLEMLQSKAIVSQIDRSAFADLAAGRKRTKTPPGFKDEGDGDFFVWIELLNGLIVARGQSRSFDRVLLVTDDVKKDWSMNGAPHPMLVAEVAALAGVPFEVMKLSDLKAAIRRALE